jgi:uncharacterized protein
MKRVLIQNIHCTGVPPLSAIYCESFFCRLRGLTFRRQIEPKTGLLLVQSRDSRIDAAIHMLFVFTDLAVVWIDHSGEVVDTCLAKRWRPFYIPSRPARYVLEMNPVHLMDFQPGNRVRIDAQ